MKCFLLSVFPYHSCLSCMPCTMTWVIVQCGDPSADECENRRVCKVRHSTQRRPNIQVKWQPAKHKFLDGGLLKNISSTNTALCFGCSVFVFCHHVSNISYKMFQMRRSTNQFHPNSGTQNIHKHHQIATHLCCWNYYRWPGYRLARQAGDRVPVKFNEKNHSGVGKLSSPRPRQIECSDDRSYMSCNKLKECEMHLRFINIAASCEQQMEWLIQFPPNQFQWHMVLFGLNNI